MQTGSEAATNFSQLTWRRHSARAARARILSPRRGLAHVALFIAVSPGLKAGSDLEAPRFWSSVRTKGTFLALTGDGTLHGNRKTALLPWSLSELIFSGGCWTQRHKEAGGLLQVTLQQRVSVAILSGSMSYFCRGRRFCLMLLLLSCFSRVRLCVTPGSPVPGILQARTLEWVAISFSNA